MSEVEPTSITEKLSPPVYPLSSKLLPSENITPLSNPSPVLSSRTPNDQPLTSPALIPFRQCSPQSAQMIRNRRHRFLLLQPAYLLPSLTHEISNPLLYDICIRRFLSPSEREAAAKKKGWAGVLESDLERCEARLAARDPDQDIMTGQQGLEGWPSDNDEPESKAEGLERWRSEIAWRFLRGEDEDFDYAEVDTSEKWDDVAGEERERMELWVEQEEERWILDSESESEPESEINEKQKSRKVEGQTGVQDF